MPVELPSAQTPLAQLTPTLHFLPAAHRVQTSAMSPQSTSDSPWFFTASLHVGAWHSRRQMPVELPSAQTPLAQLTPTLHFLPVAQRAQTSATSPQSTSDSPWFFTASLQVGARHSRRGLPVE